MKVQDRVKLKANGKTGTLFPTFYMLLSDEDDELSVAFDGQEGGTTLNCFEGSRDAFEVLGPENATPEPKKCGAGKGEACCIFLTLGINGFNCERFGENRYSLMFRKMNSKRKPTEAYPNCMNQE